MVDLPGMEETPQGRGEVKLAGMPLGLKRGRSWVFAGLLLVLSGSGVVMALSIPQAQTDTLYGAVRFPADLRLSYAKLVQNVRLFEDRQAKSHSQLVSDQTLQNRLSQVELDAASGHFDAARADIKSLSSDLSNWNLELNGGTRLATISGDAAGSKFIPILLYHYTPPNFDEQLTYLEQHGYTVVDLDTAVAGLEGEPLPPKPAVITFDDGFENQMQAFDILKKHNMKATFYIINGGKGSLWCIGAGRRYGDPLQPKNGCGDAYLNWSQVRALDESGLITIGGHTLDHSNLATLDEAEQRSEIFDSKAGIEAELGHPIKDFAYPYGSYNETTIRLVQAAGYSSAVTTLPGTYQEGGQAFMLRRVRDTLTLP
jgi:peptidoglycan/xylan/chitin deacetylase (PgdA/CDA1 family)